VCAAAITATGVDSGAVTLMLSAGSRETIYASDDVASVLEELTLTLGEGPCVDAHAGGPALVADLTAPDSTGRRAGVGGHGMRIAARRGADR